MNEILGLLGGRGIGHDVIKSSCFSFFLKLHGLTHSSNAGFQHHYSTSTYYRLQEINTQSVSVMYVNKAGAAYKVNPLFVIKSVSVYFIYL